MKRVLVDIRTTLSTRFEEGGKGPSVRPIAPSDNRGAGACIRAQCRDLPDGSRIRIIPGSRFLFDMSISEIFSIASPPIAEPLGLDEGVVNAEQLRRYNELIHRVAAFQKGVDNSISAGLPDHVLFKALGERMRDLSIERRSAN